MSLTIYQLEHSPYCIPITAALDAAGARYRTVNLPDFSRRAIIRLSKGAFYQVPFLVDGKRQVCDGRHEEFNVARHVDRHYAGGRLFPKDLEGAQAILVPHIENEVEGATFKLTDIHYYRDIRDPVEKGEWLRHKERKFGRGCLEDWRRRAPELREKFAALLRPFAQMLGRRPFLLGDTPVYADFALLGIVGNHTFRGYNRLPASLRPVAEWAERLRAWRY